LYAVSEASPTRVKTEGENRARLLAKNHALEDQFQKHPGNFVEIQEIAAVLIQIELAFTIHPQIESAAAL
jgi:hypothetical protein